MKLNWKLHLPGFARDEEGWWLAPLIRIEVFNDQDGFEDNYAIEIPFIERSRDGLHFYAVWSDRRCT